MVLWLSGFRVGEVVWCRNRQFCVFGTKLGVFHRWGIPGIFREMQELPIPCVWDKTGNVLAEVWHSHHLQGIVKYPEVIGCRNH